MNRDKVTNLKNGILQSLLMAAVVAVGLPDLAWAQDLTAVSTAGTGELTAFQTLATGVFYVGGGILMAAGALKLKEHAENPTQTPVRQGISRILVGAALIAIPFVSQAAVGTLNAGAASTTFNNFGAITAP